MTCSKVIILGQSIEQAILLLERLNIKKNIYANFQEKFEYKALINPILWKNNLYIENFNMEDCNFTHCYPEPKLIYLNVESWVPKIWNINIENDVSRWFSIDPNFNYVLSFQEKIAISTIFQYCNSIENDLLKIYQDLSFIFLQPSAARILSWCTFRKMAHIQMWNDVKKKFCLSTLNILPHTHNIETLVHVIHAIIELIVNEEPIITATIEYLTYFSNRGHLVEFITILKRRNQESYENSNVLQCLLNDFIQIHPFLRTTVDTTFKVMKIKMFNKIKIFKNLHGLEIFNKPIII